MATTNFDRFKQMKEAVSKNKGTSDLRWFKPEAGKTYTMRFLPLKSQNLEFPVDIFHHHAVTFPDGHFEGIPCPKRINNDPCPFCELATKSYKTYQKTNNEQYKEAFKKLIARTHYLLVGFNVKTIDETNLQQEDVVIVRASAKTSMELIDNQLAKGRDFIDYSEGRDVELLKAKGNTMVPVSWDFQDPSKANISKANWDKLVEISPDLTRIITPLSHDTLMSKYEEFTSVPVVSDDSSDDAEEEEVAVVTPLKTMPKAAPKAAAKKAEKAEKAQDEPDLAELRRLMDDDS